MNKSTATITIFLTVLGLIFLAGCTSTVKPTASILDDYNSFDERGISLDLKNKMTVPYLEENKLDCTKTENFEKALVGYGFYVTSKWIPSTQEGTFDSIQ